MPEAQVSLSNFTRLLDKQLMLHDGVATIQPTTTAIFGVVDSVARIVDLGVGAVFGTLVIDLQALDVNTTEAYAFVLQGSDSSDFAAGTPANICLAAMLIGDSAQAISFASADSAPGRYMVGFTNCAFRATGVATPKPKRYVRIGVLSVGVAAPAAGFDYVAYLTITP